MDSDETIDGHTGGFRGVRHPMLSLPLVNPERFSYHLVKYTMFSYHSVNSAIFLYDSTNSAIFSTQ